MYPYLQTAEDTISANDADSIIRTNNYADSNFSHNQSLINTQNCNISIDNLLTDQLQCDFLNHSPNDDYHHNLFFETVEYDALSVSTTMGEIISNCNKNGDLIEKSHTPRALKRSFIEDEEYTTMPSSKKIDLGQNIKSSEYKLDLVGTLDDALPNTMNLETEIKNKCDINKSTPLTYNLLKSKELYDHDLQQDVSSGEKSEVNLDLSSILDTNSSSSRKLGIGQKTDDEDNSTPKSQCNDIITSGNKKIRLTVSEKITLPILPYRKCNIFSAELTISIYEIAIKKISIADFKILKDEMIKESKFIFKKRNPPLDIDLSNTNSNIVKYISDKVSPYINNIMRTSDVLINSKMSTSNIKFACISNHVFFNKLNKCCIEMAETMYKIPHEDFSHIIQSRLWINSGEYICLYRKRNKLSPFIKKIIIDTILNLSNMIIEAIKELKKLDIFRGLFSFVHGIGIPQLIIKKAINTAHSINKEITISGHINDKFDNYQYLFNKSLEELKEELRNSCILNNKEKLISPNNITTKLIAKYLVCDISAISLNLYNKLRSINKEESNSDSTDFVSVEDLPATSKSEIIDPLKNKKLIPNKLLRSWNPSSIDNSSLYRYAISMIEIDKEKFESSLINKIQKISGIFNNYANTKPNFSITFNRAKNYILQELDPFLKMIEEEIKTEIKPYPDMSLEKIKSEYTSGKLFNELRKVCNEKSNNIKNMNHIVVDGIAQRRLFKAKLPLYIKQILNKEVETLLIDNISSIPEKIIDIIESLPQEDLARGFFSSFHRHIYIDNESLLKAKAVFDKTQEEIANDKRLRESVDKIAENIKKYCCDRGIMRYERLFVPVNNYIIDGELSTCSYIRKLVKKSITKLEEDLNGSIMIISRNKIVIANKVIQDSIISKFKSYLALVSLKSYKELCIKKSGVKYKHKM